MAIISGSRYSQHILPLLYLLLSRHFEIMRLARTRILNVDEMFDARVTIAMVYQPFSERYEDLTGERCGTELGKHRLKTDDTYRYFQTTKT